MNLPEKIINDSDVLAHVSNVTKTVNALISYLKEREEEENDTYYRGVDDGIKLHKSSQPPQKEEIEIVPSPRIDYCGECNKEHGYYCPKEEKTTISVGPTSYSSENDLDWKEEGAILRINGIEYELSDEQAKEIESLLTKAVEKE